MDANAKTGLMGEEPSRNGSFMRDVFELWYRSDQ